MKQIPSFIFFMLLCSSIYSQIGKSDSALLNKYMTGTQKQLGKFKITTAKTNNITFEHIQKIEKLTASKKINSAPKSQAVVEKKYLQGRQLASDQWSGYIYNIADDGTTFTYYTSCNVDPPVGPFSCNSTDVVSLKDIGICRNFTQYYAVINVSASH